MTEQTRHRRIYDRLFAVYGECGCPLRHDNPFQLLAAVMLSAQCRDERVNSVTLELFKLAPDAPQMSLLPVETIEKIIHPCGLSGNKSRNLQSAARIICELFGGEVPRTLEELIMLPGIGRKSANVVLGNAFGIPGFPVDTHVRRVLNRLGETGSDSPETIEREVNAAVAPELWTNYSHLLIQHGRHTCRARRPECGECALNQLCRKKI